MCLTGERQVYSRLLQKKPKQGGWGYGISRGGYQRNSMWNFQGLIKNEVEFRWVTKKKWCGLSRSLWFWPWKFQGIYLANIVLWNIIKYYLAQDSGFKIQNSGFMIQKEMYENAILKKVRDFKKIKSMCQQ